MDSMATADLALGTMRVRQSTLSSLCAFLVKRGHLDANPVARLDRPPHRREAPRQLPGSAIMDALVKRSEEHTSELQSHSDLVCRLLLEKKKKKKKDKNRRTPRMQEKMELNMNVR